MSCTGSLDFLRTQAEHARMSSSTPRLARFGTPTIEARDAVRARATTPFRAKVGVWSDRSGGADATRSRSKSSSQTVTPPPPFPAFRETGGSKFKHVPARYAGPVSKWQIGESCHSRQSSALTSKQVAGTTNTMWEESPASPKQAVLSRSDTRRTTGARTPAQSAMTKEAMEKFTARQLAREGEVPAYNRGSGRLTDRLVSAGDQEHDSQLSIAAAELHQTVRSIVSETDKEDVTDGNLRSSPQPPPSPQQAQSRRRNVRSTLAPL